MDGSFRQTGVLLDTWSSHDWKDGIQLENVQDMETITVRTENSVYSITVISGRTGEILIRGGRFFPELTAARLAGSSLGGSFLKLRGVYVGFRLELHCDTQRIVTSRIQEIEIPS